MIQSMNAVKYAYIYYDRIKLGHNRYLMAGRHIMIQIEIAVKYAYIYCDRIELGHTR